MELKGFRIMVTGGAGFIGSHLVDRLIEMGNYVIVYDNFDECYTGKEENIRDHLRKPNFMLIKADILDNNTLCKFMNKIDIVFHQAAQEGVRYSLENPLKTNTGNICTSGYRNTKRFRLSLLPPQKPLGATSRESFSGGLPIVQTS